MKPSEVSKLLGITPNRIKYLKRKGVFTPQRQVAENRPTDYTTHDVAELKKLVVLSKLGLTCADIKKLQDGRWTLEEAVIARRKIILARQQQILHSLELTDVILRDGAKFDTFDSNYYWDMAAQIEEVEETYQ